jgi:ribosomal protein S12 methylthiotransferase accessory factor
VGLPIAAALLVDQEEGPVPLTAGYACALGRDEALLRALLEAAQSRLTDIHGAREDVSPADRTAARDFAQVCLSARAKRRTVEMPDFSPDAASPARGLKRVLHQLRHAGFTQVAAITLDPPVQGLHVQRVVVPGMRISELL